MKNEEFKNKQFKLAWIDSGKEPSCEPDAAYPNGIDLDASDGAARACLVVLPYPAKRIGGYVIECLICGLRAACTTAGRADDPRSMKVACKTNK